jgi:O-antigen/teichoic acid export membrane protein
MAKRIGAFAGLPLLSSLAPFLLLPYIARVGGEGTWNALAIGQAVGSLAAILVALGWTLSGPARVAGTGDPALRRRLYAMSLLTRLVAFAVCLPVLAGVAAVNGGGHFWETFLMAAAQASAGLSPAWYCIAVGDARLIARYDVLPRIIATIVCIPVLLATGLIILYPAAILAGGLLGTYFFTRRHSKREDYAHLHAVPVLKEIWALRAASGTTMAAAAYAATPVLVVAAAALPSGLAVFVSAEKLYRIGLMAVGALGSSLQGWVAEIDGDHGKRRKFSLLSHTVLGLAGLAGFTFLGPFVTQLLFGQALAGDFATCFWFGLAFLFVSVNTSTGSHWLVPAGRIRAVFWSTVAGAVIGLPAMLILATVLQGAGGALGLAIGEFVVCAVQGVALLGYSRKNRVRPAGPAAEASPAAEAGV